MFVIIHRIFYEIRIAVDEKRIKIETYLRLIFDIHWPTRLGWDNVNKYKVGFGDTQTVF